MSQETDSESVATTIAKLNQAWVNARFDELHELVDPDVVLATPGFGERVRGSESYIAGHRDFVTNTKIHDFSENEIEVDIVGNSAVATYGYRLDYERSGERYESRGRDLYVLQYRDGRWRVVWRTILDVDEHPV